MNTRAKFLISLAAFAIVLTIGVAADQLHSKFVGNLLRFYEGNNSILEIDGATDSVNVTGSGGLKIGGLALSKTAEGSATTVTASDTVVTGLTTVTGCVASMDSAPTTDPEIATCSIGNQTGSPAAGSVLIQTWKTLGGTPVAATTFSKKVNWIAFGS